MYIKNSFYSNEELKQIGFKRIGFHCKISRNACFYSPEKITIGDFVRIDDFSLLSGNINIGSFIHISAYSALYGANGIYLDDFTGLSPRVTIFSATDDFSGDYMIGAVLPTKYTNVIGGEVNLEKYVQIGSGCTVLPNITFGEGSVIGAMSLVNKNIKKWTINAGIPVEFLKKRSKKLLNYSKELIQHNNFLHL